MNQSKKPLPTVPTLHTLAVSALKKMRSNHMLDIHLRAWMAREVDRAYVIDIIQDYVDSIGLQLSLQDLSSLARLADGKAEDDETVKAYEAKPLPALHAAVARGAATRAYELEKKRMLEWNTERGGPYFQMEE